ncbi:AAA family ATPase [Micromonospora haikouensis]|uniref:AAA family ATPase n=1 Tax=Micromonospora haikouensis TaxID=686309 RepID=UPI003D73A483
MNALRTRPPTGRVPWPLILIEGGEKSGKSWAAATLSASPRVGRTFWIDLGEGAGDEYGAIPGVRYEIVEHDGTWPQIIGAVEAIRDIARQAADAGQPPVVLVIDSMTALWDMLKDWATNRARATDSNKKKLRNDPNAEIVVSPNFWNDANARHRRLMTILMTFPGIAVVTARGKEVAEIGSGGSPTGQKLYKVEGHKDLAFDATAWVRMSRDDHPLIVGARSVHAGIQPGSDKPRKVPGLELERLVFEVLRCNPGEAFTRDLAPLQAGDAGPDGEPAAASRPVSSPPAARPVSGPPAVLSAAATGLLDDLAQATDETGLRRIWNAAGEAARDGRITPAELEHVRGKWRVRKEQLIPSNPATEPQHKKIHALCKEAGLDDRDTRLLFLSDVTGREIDTQRRLSVDEAKAVIDRLEAAAAQSNPPAQQEGQAA